MIALVSCADAPAAEDTSVYVETLSTHEETSSIAHGLVAYGQAIKNENYESAYSIFTGSVLERMRSVSQCSRGIESSYWLALQIDDVSGFGDGLLVRAKLMAAQDLEHYNPQGTDGQACSIWTMDYTMLWGGEG